MSLRIIEINPEIHKVIKRNQGYCLCAIRKTDDTECMCKEFREQTTAGPCRCGLYEKVNDIPAKTHIYSFDKDFDETCGLLEEG